MDHNFVIDLDKLNQNDTILFNKEEINVEIIQINERPIQSLNLPEMK